METPPALEPLAVAPLAPSVSSADASKHETEGRSSALPVAFPLEPVDRYGFLLSDKRFEGSDASADSPTRRRAAAWLENRRTQKWLRMIGKQLEDWEVCQLRHAAALKRRVRKGVPEALRGRVWSHLSGATLMLRNNPGVYPALLLQADSSSSSSSGGGGAAVADAIARDVGRTFPRHCQFREPRAGQAALANVLRAYAQYDPGVGYCQGMGFLAAMFLSYVPEPQAFWLLVASLNHRRLALADLYRPRMPKVPELLFVCERLARAHLPRLAAHLEREGLHPSMFLTQWLLTLFAYNFPFALVTRVWDAFLLEGWKVVFRVVLALLKLSQPALLARKFEGIMDFFRELPTTVDTERVLATAFKLPLKRAQLDALRLQFEREQQGAK